MGLHIHVFSIAEKPKFSMTLASSLFNGREWRRERERGIKREKEQWRRKKPELVRVSNLD